MLRATMLAHSLWSLLPMGPRTQEEEERRRYNREVIKQKVQEHAQVALQWTMRAAAVMLGVMLLFVVATLLYVLLYYCLIPARLHEQEIIFDYGAHAAVTARNQDAITLPTAHMNLLDPEHQWQASPLIDVEPTASSVLVPGLRYDILVELELAESHKNREIGMFMVQTTLQSHDGKFLASSSRPSILYDTHPLAEWTRVGLWLLPRALRLSKSSQAIRVQAINGFRESKVYPLTSALVTLNHPELQLYSAKLTIIAQLSGIRYLMYHWSVSTAIFFILNFVFAECVALLLVYAAHKLPAPDDGEAGSDADAEPIVDDSDDMVDVKKEPSDMEMPSAFGSDEDDTTAMKLRFRALHALSEVEIDGAKPS